eukprot:CAMPEP_0119420876 /NCGR_PEP_ID=MMETSP1335-20130426/24510_1 /TAXON_ID=259385 /ORGANISM="Chrysoculter rhomboideus, Strain RCC1486" /LENGTH=173 /DNA_ID=CAMNT_0007446255 /DNA_START=373 /DNA_END=891 /DNA_ORIENTATION=-
MAPCTQTGNLVKEPQDLTARTPAPRLVVIHDTHGRGQDDLPELTRREKVDNPLLEVTDRHIVPRRDDTALVNAAVELDDNLAGAVVIDDLKLANVPVLHHLLQKLDHHLRGRAQHDLPAAALLGVRHRFQRIREHADLHHPVRGGVARGQRRRKVGDDRLRRETTPEPLSRHV